jgi:hypothetical protein
MLYEARCDARVVTKDIRDLMNAEQWKVRNGEDQVQGWVLSSDIDLPP